MINPLLQKTIFISLAGHLALFNIFNFSFGRNILPDDFAKVSSLGRILTERDLSAFRPQTRLTRAAAVTLNMAKPLSGSAVAPFVTGLKPAVAFSFHPDNAISRLPLYRSR